MASPNTQNTAGAGKRTATPSGGHKVLKTALLVGLLTTVVLALATHYSLRAGKLGTAGLAVLPTDPAPSESDTAQDTQAATGVASAAAHVLTQPAMTAGQEQLRIVVVGGGLAGCTAALSVQAALQAQWATTSTSAATNTSPSQAPVEVVLVEKTPKLGGNSAKASSGINALNPPGGDSQELFERDTLKSGGDRSKPELVSTLVAQSLDGIQFLQSYGIDLSKVTQLGGHSVPRSRANPIGGNVGWTIMSKMMQAVKDAGVRVLEGHKLQELVLNDKGAVQAVVLTHTPTPAADGPKAAEQTVLLPAQAVILAAGGFAANKTLLREHCPEAAELATTNGPWAQGDVLDVARRVGAQLRDLDQVQVHPTGFVDPKEPAAGTKFLAPEKLRGVGAVLLNKEGVRFVDELTTRDKASAALTQQPGKEAWLVLSEAAAEDYGMSAMQFYVAKGLMNKVEGVAGLAALLGVDAAVVSQQLQQYNKAKEGAEADPFGKTVFPTGFDEAGVMFAGRITPVVHYTMGGVEIDSHARVLSTHGTVIPGLYAAGEVSGGVHGRNRLGGNSLLECVVYGRIAGWQAAQAVLAPAASTADPVTATA